MTTLLMCCIMSIVSINAHPLCGGAQGMDKDMAGMKPPNHAQLEKVKAIYTQECLGICISECSGKDGISDACLTASCNGAHKRIPSPGKQPVKQDKGGVCSWQADAGKGKSHPGYRAVCKMPRYQGSVPFMGDIGDCDPLSVDLAATAGSDGKGSCSIPCSANPPSGCDKIATKASATHTFTFTMPDRPSDRKWAPCNLDDGFRTGITGYTTKCQFTATPKAQGGKARIGKFNNYYYGDGYFYDDDEASLRLQELQEFYDGAYWMGYQSALTAFAHKKSRLLRKKNNRH